MSVDPVCRPEKHLGPRFHPGDACAHKLRLACRDANLPVANKWRQLSWARRTVNSAASKLAQRSEKLCLSWSALVSRPRPVQATPAEAWQQRRVLGFEPAGIHSCSRLLGVKAHSLFLTSSPAAWRGRRRPTTHSLRKLATAVNLFLPLRCSPK